MVQKKIFSLHIDLNLNLFNPFYRSELPAHTGVDCAPTFLANRLILLLGSEFVTGRLKHIFGLMFLDPEDVSDCFVFAEKDSD